ncbi:MAG: cell surface protein [Lachnospiraceae bacterium]|nr:cell surface protein [Lachnospiraceae bacterium]
MAVILMLAVVFKFAGPSGKSEKVERFRGARLEAEIWNPMIAESINKQTLTLLVDNRELTNKEHGIFMDQQLNLMIPLSALGDSFHCSAHLYEKQKLVLEKRSDVIAFQLEEDKVRVNGKKEKIASPMTYIDGEYYVAAKTVAEKLDFNYNWDIEKNQAIAVDAAKDSKILPLQYDLRDRQRAPKIKNQGPFGTCWAFAALSAMESALLPEEEWELSPDHMTLQNGFVRRQAEGGEYTMGMAYLAAWQGPVNEKDDPYGDGVSEKGLKPVKHVQEIQLLDGKDFEKIKESVFLYGGVQTAIYSALENANANSPYYNSKTYAYCYAGAEKPNHEIMIIGWDDTFPKENFNLEVEDDGAFLCQNSWGEEFGDQGVFYVSYYDVNIGSHGVIYTGIEETDNYDQIYQSDLCGWVGQLGYNKESVYGANVYTARSAETLQAAGFYATGKETSYELYVVNHFENTDSLTQRVKVASGVLANPGFYTINFEKECQVEQGEKFAVVLQVTTPGSVHPLAIEYAADEMTAGVDLSDGQGYISSGGKKWESAEDKQDCNLCLKVYTRNNP